MEGDISMVRKDIFLIIEMKAIELLKLSDSEIKKYFKQHSGSFHFSHFYFRFWDGPKIMWWRNMKDGVKIIKRFPLIDFLNSNPPGLCMEMIVNGVKRIRLKADGDKITEIIRYDTRPTTDRHSGRQED